MIVSRNANDCGCSDLFPMPTSKIEFDEKRFAIILELENTETRIEDNCPV